MLVRIADRPKRKAINWLVDEASVLPDFSVTHMDPTGTTVELNDSDAEDFMEQSEASRFTCYAEDDGEKYGTPRTTSAGQKKGDSAFKMPKYRP